MALLRKEYDLKPLVIHDTYLINLSSIDPTIRLNSISCYRGEVERAMLIGAEYLVAHPGSYKGQTVEEGIAACVAGLTEAVQGLKSKKLTLLLENTAGGGAALGSRLEELAAIRHQLKSQVGFAIGYCLDTCHLHAAGYDVSSLVGFKQTIRAIEYLLGLENVPVIHVNDSKTPRGSRIDRHANIGEGQIGLEAFRRILNHPQLSKKAFILETPMDHDGDDLKNVQTLKKLVKKKRVTADR